MRELNYNELKKLNLFEEIMDNAIKECNFLLRGMAKRRKELVMMAVQFYLQSSRKEFEDYLEEDNQK